MSLTTRCPACSTRFRVVPDQLKISDGWVRCGHCSNVFDATLHLSASLMLSPALAEPMADIAASPAASVPDPVPEPPPADNPISDFHAALQAFASQSAPAALDVDLSSQLPEEPAAVPAAPATASADSPAEPASDVSEADVPTEIPSFVREARRQAFWRSTPMRAVLLLSVLLLGSLLAAQWAFHQRSWLAARHPALKPLLVQACESLGCSVEPLRRIDAIVIDSATLVRRLGQFHSFDIVLQNTADVPLAAPALELSLTDVGDRVIARRVFLPSEWPQAITELPPRATVPVSFRLSIASSDDLPMAGYRALVFYP